MRDVLSEIISRAFPAFKSSLVKKSVSRFLPTGRGREGSVAGRGRNDKPPTVARGKMKSITVAASKSKGSGGSTKYCYGCGATIVKKNDIDVQTEEAGGKIRYNNDDSGNNVRMGLKASSGGMYPFVLNIYCILLTYI